MRFDGLFTADGVLYATVFDAVGVPVVTGADGVERGVVRLGSEDELTRCIVDPVEIYFACIGRLRDMGVTVEDA